MKAVEFDKNKPQTINLEQEMQRMQQAVPPLPGNQTKTTPAVQAAPTATQPVRAKLHQQTVAPIQEEQPLEEKTTEPAPYVDYQHGGQMHDHQSRNTEVWQKVKNWN